jgi:hypothetical protein
LGLHKHGSQFKLKQVSGLVSLSERESSKRNKYFLRVQAYGIKHNVYKHTYALKSACPNAYSSWNYFHLEVPNYCQYIPCVYPFTDTPPLEMSPPIRQAELIPINKNLVSSYEIQTVYAEQIPMLYSNHINIYSDGCIQGEHIPSRECI